MIQAYRESDGSIPVWEWLQRLQRTDKKAAAKCIAIIQRLRQLGNELRRPEADRLRDGIFELRARVRTVNYRVLYGFNGQNVALLLLGCTKEGKVPDSLIDTAIARKKRAVTNPRIHIATFDE